MPPSATSTPTTLGKVLDDVFGRLPAEPQLTAIADAAPAAVPKPVVVKFEGPQSVAIFGRQGVARNHPDHMAALVVTQILGGGSSEARLVQEVREKRGLAYWVYSLLFNFKHASVLIGGVASPNEEVAKSLDLIRNEFKQLAEKGPSQREVDAAKSFLIGSYVLSLDSNAKIAEQMLRSQLQGLGPGFHRPAQGGAREGDAGRCRPRGALAAGDRRPVRGDCRTADQPAALRAGTAARLIRGPWVSVLITEDHAYLAD